MKEIFRNIPKLNLGIWSAYKKLNDEQKLKFRQFMRIKDLSFKDIAELPYFSAINARERIDSIKDEEKRIEGLEEYHEIMMKEKERYMKEFQEEYERLGLDPNYSHHGLNQ